MAKKKSGSNKLPQMPKGNQLAAGGGRTPPKGSTVKLKG